MNIRNMKIRGAMMELDRQIHNRLERLKRLASVVPTAQLNTPAFDKVVEQMDQLVHEIEAIRAELVTITNRAHAEGVPS